MADACLHKIYSIMGWASPKDFLIPMIGILIETLKQTNTERGLVDPYSFVSVSTFMTGDKINYINWDSGILLNQILILYCLCCQFTAWQLKLKNLQHLGLSYSISEYFLDFNTFIALSPVARLHVVLSTLAPMFIIHSTLDDDEKMSFIHPWLEIDSEVFKNVIFEVFIVPVREIPFQIDNINIDNYESVFLNLIKKINRYDYSVESTLIQSMKEAGLLIKSLNQECTNNHCIDLCNIHLTFDLFNHHLHDLHALILDSILIQYLWIMLNSLNHPHQPLPYLLSPFATALGFDINNEFASLPFTFNHSHFSKECFFSTSMDNVPKWISTIGFLSTFTTTNPLRPPPSRRASSHLVPAASHASNSSSTTTAIATNSSSDYFITIQGRLGYLPFLLFLEIVSGSSVRLDLNRRLIRSDIVLASLLKTSVTKILPLVRLPAFCIMNAIERCLYDLSITNPSDLVSLLPGSDQEENPPKQQQQSVDRVSVMSSSVNETAQEFWQTENLWLNQAKSYLEILIRLRQVFFQFPNDFEVLRNSIPLQWQTVTECETLSKSCRSFVRCILKLTSKTLAPDQWNLIFDTLLDLHLSLFQ